jgi:predicted HicB family RNase H-like nuclease
VEGVCRKQRPILLPERLMFRCSKDLARLIRLAAAEQEVSPSELTRRIVRDRLKRGAEADSRAAAV